MKRYASLYEQWDQTGVPVHRLKGDQGGLTWCGLNVHRMPLQPDRPFIGFVQWNRETEETTCSACCAILGIDREAVGA